MIHTRLIIDPPQSPVAAMAGDTYMLALSASTGDSIVRLYRWDKPTITLGFMQSPDILDRKILAKEGIEWIRRPTGGRAVLHHNDITYSVAFPRSELRLGTSLLETYKIVAMCLEAGLERAGVHASRHDSCIDPRLVRRESKLPCFLAPNRDEIMANGRKLFGSAQKRTRDAVLQHGSIPVSTDFRKLPRYSALSEEQRRIQSDLLAEKCACIEESRPGLDPERLIDFLAEGFAQCFPVPLVRSHWSDNELEAIKQLACSPEFVARYLTA